MCPQTERVGTLLESELVNKENHAAVCLYMLRCADYVADKDEEQQLLEVAFVLYRTHGKLPDALRVALRLGDTEKTTGVLEECNDAAVKKQMAYILARQHTAIVEEDDEDLADIMGNLTLSELFASLAKELDVVEPKTPEQIYKSHLAETGSTATDRGDTAPESARGNLASTFVNAFVNAGYCHDSLVSPDGSKWVFKHKDHGLISAAAAYGMVVMWSVDNLTDLDDLLEDKSDNIKAGAVRVHARGPEPAARAHVQCVPPCTLVVAAARHRHGMRRHPDGRRAGDEHDRRVPQRREARLTQHEGRQGP